MRRNPAEDTASAGALGVRLWLMKDSGRTRKEDRYLVNHLGSKGKENNSRIRGGSTMQPPNKSPPLIAGAGAPHFNEASSGGFAVGPEVTIQETYKNSAHDGDNPIRPGTLARIVF